MGALAAERDAHSRALDTARERIVVTPRPLWPVAVHESGHVVCRLALGLRVTRVAIESNGAGMCDFPVLFAYADTDPQILLRHCVSTSAGVAAQAAFTQGYSAADLECGGSADRADAERLATLISEDDAPEILERAEAMAGELVTQHREASCVLARQLYQRGGLIGAEVRASLAC